MTGDAPCPASCHGLFVAVVGASGAGKDSILSGARAQLEHRRHIHFIRRVITRPADPHGEDHVVATADMFASMRDAGRFALHWHAHGLHYGIARTAFDLVRAGDIAVANVSRGVLADLATAELPHLVVEISTDPAILAARLAARGRETAGDIRARLERAAPIPPGLNLHRIANNGALDEAVAAFVALLEPTTLR